MKDFVRDQAPERKVHAPKVGVATSGLGTGSRYLVGRQGEVWDGRVPSL